MEVDEGVRNATDIVTILLVPKSTTEQGNAAKKRKRSLEPAEVPPRKIQADSSKLRECSKYFATCMSGRWTTDTPREFYLEMQTDAQYYRDCFARMYFPFKPIASVALCIELLKVASQIDCAQVLDIGVKYLAAVSWSDNEEKQIRSFCKSGQLSLNTTSDLYRRLQLPSNGEERQQNHLNLTERVLCRSLKVTLSGLCAGHSELRAESRKVFSQGFQAIISGSGSGKNGKVLQIALALVTGESKSLLLSLKKACRGSSQTSIFDGVHSFCWLFEEMRTAKAAQPLVEQILKDGDIATLLQSKFQSISHTSPVPGKSFEELDWANMMCEIFCDVLDGRLFLTTSERLTLFQRWNYFFKTNLYDANSPLGATLVFRFILTFPHEEQEEIYRSWLSTLDDPAQKAQHYDLSETHSLWMTHLVSQAEKLADAPEYSSTGWESI